MTSKKPNPRNSAAKKQSPWALPIIGLVILAFVVVILLIRSGGSREQQGPTAKPSQAARPKATPNPITIEEAKPAVTATPTSTGTTMEVNKAVMVTAELNFGTKAPSIAQALSEIDRRYQPEDGIGRTFAILDAYGEPTADGKLHISMHVSSEKPGRGSIVFKRTGEVLWDSAITAVPGSSSAKDLNVYLGDEAGGSWLVDGSSGAEFILDAKLRDKGTTVRDYWRDGEEREVTLVYSACGCPVKVMARRVGERTVRTKDLPVIFPDDPEAVRVIAGLMRW